VKNSFIYDLPVDYSVDYPCDGECTSTSICRCLKIINQRVSKVDISILSHRFFKDIFLNDRDMKIKSILFDSDSSEIELYFINRILSINKVWMPEEWKVIVENSYYGEEVVETSLNERLFTKVLEQCKKVFSLGSIDEKIKFVLELEYKELPNFIKSSSFRLIEIDKSKIKFTNQKHLESVLEKDLSFYSEKNYDVPRGVVKKNGDIYTIIDGYHRISQYRPKKIKVFEAYEI
jgi:hypothetical protein